VLKNYKAAEGIDRLYQVIQEARVRKDTDERPGKDIWIPGLEPRAAVRTRVIPVLQTEKERLEILLAQLEADSGELTQDLRQNEARQETCGAVAHQWLNALEEAAVMYKSIPDDQVQLWSIEMQETGS